MSKRELVLAGGMERFAYGLVVVALCDVAKRGVVPNGKLIAHIILKHGRRATMLNLAVLVSGMDGACPRTVELKECFSLNPRIRHGADVRSI